MKNPICHLIPVSLRNKETGQYLYSTDVRFAHHNSSRQQLVATTSGEVSTLGHWAFKQASTAFEAPAAGQPFQSGVDVRIEHIQTGKNLHSHQGHLSPTGRSQEITAYGGLGIGDENDDWTVEVLSVGQEDPYAEVRLKHVKTGHFLNGSITNLVNPPVPSSQEVAAVAAADHANNVWIVEPVGLPAISLSGVSLHVDIPKKFLRVTFASTTSVHALAESINKWIADEESKWSWLQQRFQATPVTEQRGLQPIVATYENSFRRAREAVQQVVADNDSPGFADSLSSLVKTLVDIYTNPPALVYSAEPTGMFLLEKAKVKPGEALAATGVTLGLSVGVQSVDTVRGIMAADNFMAGSSAETPAATFAALETLREQWRVQSEAVLLEVKAKTEEADRTIRLLGEKATAFDERSNKLIAEKTESYHALINTLKEKVSLDNSIEYWKARAAEAHKRFIGFGAACIVFVVLAAISLVVQFNVFFVPKEKSAETPLPSPPAVVLGATVPISPGAKSAPAVPEDKEFSTMEKLSGQYWKFLIVAITLTFVIWILRVLVKITLSNLHISTDAKERVTMLQTFLSLMSDKSLQREDIKLILHTVFRPGATGLIAEETGVQTPLEMVLKNVGGVDDKK